MKYIKNFNESLYNLKPLCDDYLSYLKDSGFRIIILEKVVGIYIIKNNGTLVSQSDYQEFRWKDIRDDLIPFINLLVDKYGANPNLTCEIEYGKIGDVINQRQVKLIDFLNDEEYLDRFILRSVQLRF